MAKPLLVLVLVGAIWVSNRNLGATELVDRMGKERGPHREVPVLLVPGWLDGEEDLAALRDRFLRDGWEEWEVMALGFRDPVGSNRDHAVELEVAMDALLSQTGAPEIDVVAFSMGGLALWLLLQQKGDVVPIRRVVFLGSPLQGTLTAYLAWGKGGEEMRPGSPFLQELLSGPSPQRWVEALTIRTPLDLNVVPGSGGTLPGMGDRMVCCPTHQGLLDHEEAYVLVRDFLRRGPPGEEERSEGGNPWGMP